MSDLHRIFGGELSPYSIKVRAYFRYKQIPHEWIVRNLGNMEEFRRHAKLPLIPLVITPDGEGLQDSTPILEHLEALHPSPSLTPDDPALAFVSALIEEFGDEWVVKPMFHHRWTHPADRDSAALRIATDMAPDAGPEVLEPFAASIRERMVSRLAVVGSTPETRPLLEGSFAELLQILERHLAARPFLLGGRPALADFGLGPELFQCATDPTAGALMRLTAPHVVAWCERMLSPQEVGPFQPWAELSPTLEPLLERQIARYFLPWSDANARAVAAGESRFSVKLGGHPFAEAAAKYPAKSLSALRQRLAAVPERDRLDEILARTDCLAWLR